MKRIEKSNKRISIWLVQNPENRKKHSEPRTGVRGEVGSSKWVCFLELDLASDFELARFKFNVLEEPDRLSDFNKDPSLNP